MAYAIVKTRGQQFKAVPGKTIRIPLALDLEPGDEISFDDVLLANDGETTRAGSPTVDGATVKGQVIGHVAGKKLYVFRFKRRKNYRKKTGHRQKFTEVMITDVKAGS